MILGKNGLLSPITAQTYPFSHLDHIKTHMDAIMESGGGVDWEAQKR